MAKLWKSMCKSLRESMLKNCAEKSGKKLNITKMVEKNLYSHSFTKSFHVLLNRTFTAVKYRLFHIFHIAYYYNY